jgi:hypothetical protein
MKFRRDRRTGFPIVPAWRFYPAYAFETIRKLAGFVSLYLRLRKIYVRIKKDPKRYEYSDLALTAVEDDDVLELFHTRPVQRQAASA